MTDHDPYAPPKAESHGATSPGTHLRNYTREELLKAISDGARCVTFGYCYSLIHSFSGESEIRVVRSWGQAISLGLGYTISTFLFGWWGFYGIFLTPVALFMNLRGGNDVTDAVVATMESEVLSDRLLAGSFQAIEQAGVETPPEPEDFLRNLERNGPSA